MKGYLPRTKHSIEIHESFCTEIKVLSIYIETHLVFNRAGLDFSFSLSTSLIRESTEVLLFLD